MTFTDYCKQNNIQLYEKDFKWICYKLKKTPQHTRIKIMKGYTETWMDVLLHCADQENKQEMGRIAANAYLSVLL